MRGTQSAGSTVLGGFTELAGRLLSASGPPVEVQIWVPADGTLANAARGDDDTLDVLCQRVAAGGPIAVDDAAGDPELAELAPVAAGTVRAYLGVPLHDPAGAVVGVLSAFSGETRIWTAEDRSLLADLAARVSAQLDVQQLAAEMQTNRLRWDVALEAAGIGSFDWDLRTGRLDWDERMQTLFGYAPGEFKPHIDTGFERIHPEDRDTIEGAIAAAVAAVGDYRAEFRALLPGGRQRWMAARGRAVAGPDGTAARLVGTAYDITEIRTARDEAARLLETMQTGFAAVDLDWRVTYLNSEGARVVGLTADELIGRTLWEAFPGLEDSEFGRQYRTAMSTMETVEFEAHYGHLASWFEVRAVPSTEGLSLYFLDVTARHLDQERAQAAAARLELLATVSAELAAAGLDIENAVARLAQTVVPQLADWCIVSLPAEGNRLRDVGSWHVDPELRSVVELYTRERLIGRTDMGPLQRARETGQAVVMPGGVTEKILPTLVSEPAKEALRMLAPESAVIVPLTARGNLTGVLAMARRADRPPMSDEEIRTATDVAARAALALDNASLYTAQQSLAEGLQRSLLTTPPEPDHCQIVVRYVAASEAARVGGDWFDSFLQPDGATVLVIGDVMGHDADAAAAMGQVRSLLRGIAWYSGAAPAEVLTGLDAAMRGLQVATTATAVVARLEQSEDERERGITRLRWSNAGHPPPMALNPDGTVTVLTGVQADLLLGIDPATPRTESAVVLDRGATVLLYTDGLVERRGQDLDTGLALLRETLADLTEVDLDTLCDSLLQRLLPAEAQDDVALVAVRLHRQDEPRPPEAGPERVPPGVPDDD